MSAETQLTIADVLALAVLAEIVDGLDRMEHIRQAALTYLESRNPQSETLALARKRLAAS